MALLTREQILAVDDVPRKLVKVPQWKGEVYVRVMTGAERDQFEERYMREKGTLKLNFRAYLVAMCACDENGDPLFTLDDVEALGRKSAAGLEAVYSTLAKLSAITAADVDELEKN